MNGETPEAGWEGLYRAGGVAALVAGIIFRRNLGAEIALFSAQKQPEAVNDWYRLLQENRLLGLAYLNIFDLVNYALVGVMYLALYAALRRAHKSQMAIATTAALVGIAVYFASNTALSMLTLSEQYAAATGEAQRSTLVAAGQALLALNRFSSPGAQPGAGGYLSLLLIAAAGMMTSLVMLRSDVFSRVSALVGVLASGLDLAYCTAYAYAPAADSERLAVIFIPAAGLFWMVWHVWVGWRLLKSGEK
jgi:hypothetical protein